MTLYITWYSRHDDFSPAWGDPHHGTVKGENAADCMRQFRDFKNNHDLVKFTIPEIVDIKD